MHKRVATAVLGVAAFAATLGTAGCDSSPHPAATEPSVVSTSASAAPVPGPVLPDPAALTDVLYRLADPAVPGADKIMLIEGASADDAEAIDKFASALADNGFAPVTFTASALGWSDRTPGDVVATIDVTPSAAAGDFNFPMDFHPHAGGWQLARVTSDLLLSLGDRTEPTPPPPVPPSPTP